jgi:tRNA1Val (adenine37-N6)-methyltransferase
MDSTFQFKQFRIEQDLCAMKVGTDGVLLGAWAEGGKRILDIGCGTGVVSLMMAQRFTDARITAIDIIEDCCRQTLVNAEKSLWGERIKVEHCSLQDFTKLISTSDSEGGNAHSFDCIVSNPPFFVNSLKNPDKARATARHEDSLPFGVMAKCVSGLLANGGLFSVILAEECCARFIDEAWFSGLYLSCTVNIITKKGKPIKRRLLRFSNVRDVSPIEETVILLNDDRSRSEWFKTLTADFYL